MLVKVKSEEFKSVDRDYQGSEKYHKGEKVYFGNPDSEYHGAYGKFQEIEKRDYPDEDICIVEITSPLFRILTFREAAEKYDIDSSALRHAIIDNRFRRGEIRKSGGTWLVTREAMERLYGKGEGKMFLKVIDNLGNDGKELFDGVLKIKRSEVVTEVIEEGTEFVIAVDAKTGKQILQHEWSGIKVVEA